MACESEEIKRLKLKLQLYGSYTREIEQKEHRYFEIEQELNANDNIHNSAKNLGIKSNDPYRTSEEILLLEYASLKQEMQELEMERVYLGLESFWKCLEGEEWKLIHHIYVDELSQTESGAKSGMSRRTVQNRMKKILKKVNVCAPAHTKT